MSLFELYNKTVIISKLIIPEGTIHVALVGCRITSIDDLRIPESVTHLNLSQNLLKNINNVKWPKNAISVNLSDNSLENINNVHWPNTITYINLSNNLLENITNVQWPDTLDNLELSNNNLTVIDRDQLSNKIKYLRLNNNKLTNCDFVNNNDNIVSLELSNNNIHGDIVMYSNAKILDLSGNKITGLVLHTTGIRDLAEVDLVRNNISDLNKIILPNAYKRLMLTNNFIENIPQDYQFSRYMQYLELSGNLIKSLKNITFVTNDKMNKLKNIDLSNNLIADLDYVVFQKSDGRLSPTFRNFLDDPDPNTPASPELKFIDLSKNYINNYDVPAITTLKNKNIRVTNYGNTIIPRNTSNVFRVETEIQHSSDDISLNELSNNNQGVHKFIKQDIVKQKINIVMDKTSNVPDLKNLQYFFNKYPDIASRKEYIDTYTSHYADSSCYGTSIVKFLINSMNFVEMSSLSDKNQPMLLIAMALEDACKAYTSGSNTMSCAEGACDRIIHALMQSELFPANKIDYSADIKDSVMNFLAAATSAEPRIPEESIKTHLLMKMRDKYSDDFHKYKKLILSVIDENIIYYGGRKTIRGGRKSAKKQLRKKSIKKISRKKSAKKQSCKKQSRKKSTKKISRRK